MRLRRLRTPSWLVRSIVVVAIAVGLIILGRSVSFEQVGSVLRRADFRLLAATLPLLAINFLFRSVRFMEVLGAPPPPREPVSFGGFVAAIVLNHAANNVLPLRAGDLVRTREFVRRGYPLVAVAVAQIIDKAVEGVTLCGCTLPVLVLLSRRLLVGAIVLFVVGLPVLFWFVMRTRAALSERRLVAENSGLGQRGIRGLLRAGVWSLAADVFEVALIYVSAKSINVDLGLAGCLTVYAAVNLAIAIPSTPGQFGVLEAGASLGLIALGVDRDSAIAFAVVYRVVQWIPVTAAGAGILLWRKRRIRART